LALLIYFSPLPSPPTSPLFPYTTLFRSNHHLLTDVLKDEWKFRGLVVSDWADIENLYTRDHVAATPKDAVRMSVMAGVDMSMVPDRKSTRLNSSHVAISYAVFCLKKKKK